MGGEEWLNSPVLLIVSKIRESGRSWMADRVTGKDSNSIILILRIDRRRDTAFIINNSIWAWLLMKQAID